MFASCLRVLGSRVVVVVTVSMLAFGAIRASAQSFTLLDEICVARPGVRAIVPVQFARQNDARRPWPAFLDDGRGVATEVYRIEVHYRQGNSPMARWLGPVAEWRSIPVEQWRDDGGAGFWAFVFQIPAEAKGGAIRVGGQTIPLIWVIGGGDTQARLAGLPTAPGVHRLDAATLAEVQAVLRNDPIRLWRLMLLASGNEVVIPLIESIADPVIRLYAEQRALAWSMALSRLSEIDPELEEQVLARLGGVMRVNAGLHAPLWHGEDSELEQLRLALLSSTWSEHRIAALVADWVRRRPAGIAMTLDDGGRLCAAGGVRGTVGVVNMSDVTVLAWIEGGRGPERTEPTTVAPWTLTELPFDGELFRVDQMPGTEREPGTEAPVQIVPVDIRLARQAIRMFLAMDAIRVAPPGLTVGRLLPEWTMVEWMSQAEAPAGRTASAFRVHRIPSRVLEETVDEGVGVVRRERIEPGRWVLYFESRSGGRDELVRVWLGTRGNPSHLVRIRPSAAADDELTPGVVDHWRCVQAMSDGVWAFELEIPDDAIGRNGVLRIGIEHIHAEGRDAWPRRMFPWQVEPGRAALDLRHWRSLGR
ncbi:MAG: hypothetical protein KIT24_12405 [Phycisphaeraceae bacterium]|nr:hypothetical protein [Phycisphaeraceae bacterium]